MIHFINFFPIPFIASLAILGGALWLRRSRGCFYLLALTLFWGYCLVVINVMFFPLPVPSDWPHNLNRDEVRQALASINWIPFNYHKGGGLQADIRSGFSDVVINVLMTIPIGVALCYLFRPRWYAILFIAPAVGLAFEGAQLFFKIVLGVFFHAVDMSDVVTNGMGVLIGALIFAAADLIGRFVSAPKSK